MDSWTDILVRCMRITPVGGVCGGSASCLFLLTACVGTVSLHAHYLRQLYFAQFVRRCPPKQVLRATGGLCAAMVRGNTLFTENVLEGG